MTFQIKIPRLAIPEFTVKRGQLLDVEFMGLRWVVPPMDITFWPEIQLIPETVVFDSAWIWEFGAKILSENVDAVIKAMEEEVG